MTAASRPLDPPSSATDDDAVSVAGVRARGAKRDRQAVPAADRRRPSARRHRRSRHDRSMSRCTTAGSSRGAESGCASSSAITTERCRPPVQPTATRRYDLPSPTNAGQQEVEQLVERARGTAAVSGWPST